MDLTVFSLVLMVNFIMKLSEVALVQTANSGLEAIVFYVMVVKFGTPL
jgi:hypothetical protein